MFWFGDLIIQRRDFFQLDFYFLTQTSLYSLDWKINFMKYLKIRNITIGKGTPKIAVSLTEKKPAKLIAEAQKIVSEQPDIIEWRIDFLADLFDLAKLKKLAADLRMAIGDTVLLITLRTKKEGGNQALSDTDYFNICKYVIENKLSDLIDIELLHQKTKVRQLLLLAHANGLKVILSSHDFKKTPKQAEICNRLTLMEKTGADLAKVAVMPQNVTDVLNLLVATSIAQSRLTIPLITISMGKMGKISRISGQLFGSAVTFGTVTKASAPGQIALANLKKIIETLEL